MSDIQFGTDGWRAVIGEGFTFRNLERVADAAARFFLRKKQEVKSVKKRSLVFVGYDCRFHSERFALRTARIFAAHGFDVLLSDAPVPTPALSQAIVEHGALGGIMITASHNPCIFNGFKVKMHYGASAPVRETRMIEELISEISKNDITGTDRGVRKTSFLKSYIKCIGRVADMGKIRKNRSHIIVDPMHGSGAGIIEAMLRGGRCGVSTMRGYRDPLFGGVAPEPIEKNLKALITAVRKKRNHIGIAFDGDADRIGLVDEDGTFVNSHQIFGLLAWHCAEHRKMKGRIVKTISGTYMIDRIARQLGREVVETPIGFKNISDQMICGDVMIGGEESGGIGFAGHIPERDAVLSAMYILEMMAMAGKSLKTLTKELSAKAGPSSYGRIDVGLSHIVDRDEFREMIKRQSRKIHFEKPQEIKDFDGVKFIWKDDSWLLLRISGTEPIMRIYAESNTDQKMQNLLALGKQFQYN